MRLAARLPALALSALLSTSLGAVPVLAAAPVLLGARTAQAADAFVGNKSSKVFHQADCRLAGSLKAQNRTSFPSVDAALQAGFKPCKVCHPAGAAQAAQGAAAIVASDGGDTFHKASCVEAKRIKKKHRRQFASAQEAAAAGLKPCKLCKP